MSSQDGEPPAAGSASASRELPPAVEAAPNLAEARVTLEAAERNEAVLLEPAARELIVRQHFDYVWRLLRRLGLPEADADDAAQEVFLVGLRRWAQIQPGRERAFLYGCALNKAVQFKKRRTSAELPPEDEHRDAAALSVEELLDRKRAHDVLDRILDTLPDEQRAVFVLFEIEQLSTSEIAEILDVARGTVASRLRLARGHIQGEVQRLQAETAVSRGGVAEAGPGLSTDIVTRCLATLGAL